MRRIAYLLHWNQTEQSGVFHKVVAQIKAWQKLHHTVHLFILSTESVQAVWKKALPHTSVTNIQYTSFDRLFSSSLLALHVQKYQPHLIYTRYDTFYPAFAVIFKLFPTVFEINTDATSEFKISSGVLKQFYHHCTQHLYLKLAAGFVCVTHELLLRLGSPKKSMVIGNSIDLAHYPVLPVSLSKTLQLVFMATENVSWQGFDKIKKLAEIFKHWHFHIIGFTDSTGPTNMTFHGSLPRERYQKILQECHVAIGTLALHRKNMDEACTLKVREYLAFGLPVILAYHDTDFLTPNDFMLRLPNVENNVELYAHAIEKFVNEWRGKRVERQHVQHLDTSVKEKQRVEFFKTL